MSLKNLDRQGRLRDKIVSFRMSPEEDNILERKVALSGMTKQDYILNCLLDKEIIVKPNPYVIRSLQNELREFIRLQGMEISKDNEEMIFMALKMIISMAEDGKTKLKR